MRADVDVCPLTAGSCVCVLHQGGQSIGFFLRDTLAAPYTSWSNLINTLNNTLLIAPSYIIVGGVNPGVCVCMCVLGHMIREVACDAVIS